MKTLNLTPLLALTALSGAIVIAQPAKAFQMGHLAPQMAATPHAAPTFPKATAVMPRAIVAPHPVATSRTIERAERKPAFAKPANPITSKLHAAPVATKASPAAAKPHAEKPRSEAALTKANEAKPAAAAKMAATRRDTRATTGAGLQTGTTLPVSPPAPTATVAGTSPPATVAGTTSTVAGTSTAIIDTRATTGAGLQTGTTLPVSPPAPTATVAGTSPPATVAGTTSTVAGTSTAIIDTRATTGAGLQTGTTLRR